MTFWLIFSPNFLRSSSVHLFVFILLLQLALCLAPGRAYETIFAGIYVKYILSLVISYAIMDLPRCINSFCTQIILWKIYTKLSDIICCRARVQVSRLFLRAKNFMENL